MCTWHSPLWFSWLIGLSLWRVSLFSTGWLLSPCRGENETLSLNQIGKLHYYRPQRKSAKAMFLHLSVSHSVHRGCVQAQASGGTSAQGVSRPRPGECLPRECPGPGGAGQAWGVSVYPSMH